MKQLTPYLFFSGQCEEALKFYKDCLGGEIVKIQRFKDSPVNVPDEYKSKIMHAEFKVDELFFMASDGMPDKPEVSGDNIFLSMQFTSKEEQERVFKALTKGGTILMPLEKTFWGSTFGQLKDRFGINWMLKCSLQDEKYGY